MARPIGTPFIERYIVNKDTNCWEWKYPSNGRCRYGSFANQGAHRYSYKLHKGEIPEGICVLHKCDNDICVNPDHLFLGTIGDNNKDRHMKGRDNAAAPIGIRNGKAKLTEKQVRKIKQSDESLGVLSHRYAVNRSTIRDIRIGVCWKHIQIGTALSLA